MSSWVLAIFLFFGVVDSVEHDQVTIEVSDLRHQVVFITTVPVTEFPCSVREGDKFSVRMSRGCTPHESDLFIQCSDDALKRDKK